MNKYINKKTKEIVKAERFKKGMEDGYFNNKFLFFKSKIPYIITTITGELLTEIVNKNYYIIYYETKERIFKGIYHKKIFNKYFKKIKE